MVAGNARVGFQQLRVPGIRFGLPEIGRAGTHASCKNDPLGAAGTIQFAAEPRQLEVEHPETEHRIAGGRGELVGLREVVEHPQGVGALPLC